MPPLPLRGLAEQQLEAAIRAYVRRPGNLASGLSLRGLRAVDQKLNALMQAACYYGPDMLQDLDRLTPKLGRQDEAGLAFVRVLLSQMHGTSWDAQRSVLLQLEGKHPVAVRDALWFYGDAKTCIALLTDSDLTLVRLGVELAGRQGLTHLRPHIDEAADKGIDADECLLACTRMGHAPHPMVDTLIDALQGYNLARHLVVLDVLAVAGQHMLHRELLTYIGRLTASDGPTEQSHPGVWGRAADTAVSIWIAREPKQALDAVINGLRIPRETALRAVAAAGRIDGLLPVLDHLEGLDRALEGAEQDVIRLVFGRLPAELIHTQGNAPARRTALRQLACNVFAANGCSGLRPEQITRWNCPEMKERTWALEPIRLRHGRPLQNRHHPLEGCFDLSHAMRRWLYVAHATQTAQPFVLSHEDLATRQMECVESLLLLRSLEAGDAD